MWSVYLTQAMELMTVKHKNLGARRLLKKITEHDVLITVVPNIGER